MQSLIPPSQPPPRLLVVGLNHRTAPLALRETVAFTAAQAAAAGARFKARFPRTELVILSTCNRVEFYLAGPAGEGGGGDAGGPAVADLAAFVAAFHGLPAEGLHGHLYHHEGRAMVAHLFSVASSLDSMVLGETQILSQVKHAYQDACRGGDGGHGAEADGTVGKVLHGLFQRALAAAKDVHESTGLAAGHLSVASVAVDVAASVFDRFDDKTVLCLGAGKMATLMLRHLAGLRPKKLLIANRSAARAEALAATFGGEARTFDAAGDGGGLDALLAEADILLTSTGATAPIISEARFKAVLKPRRYRPIVMVDIAVPRDVDPAVAKLPNVYLYNIDDLQEVAAGNRGRRDAEIARSRAVVERHVDEFFRWFAARDVGPVVKALYDQSHALARAELEAHLARHPDLSADQRAELQRLTHRLVGKLLHGPVTRLTSHADPAARPLLTAALQQLFSLDGIPPGTAPGARPTDTPEAG
jgi:glutamyl-tRNA reductase